MELLIVGAGAVGATYGYLASRPVPGAGAKITYLVKPKHRADLRDGIRLYAWKRRRAEPVHFRDFSIVDGSEALRHRKFDAVLITLPSDRFREGSWLRDFLSDFDSGSPKARIWSLQSSMNDPSFLRETLGADGYDSRVVTGSIPIVAYLAPLPGEPFEAPGYAFYVPPGAKAKWSAKNGEIAEEAARLFDSGGLPSKVVSTEAKPNDLLPESMLRSVVAGLEKSEWSFDRLVNGGNFPLVVGGIREMMTISAKIRKVPDPGRKAWVRLAASEFGIRSALRIARKVIPFDFESFLRVHFTKVEAQMNLHLDEMIEFGKRNGISTTNLVLLRGRRKPK